MALTDRGNKRAKKETGDSFRGPSGSNGTFERNASYATLGTCVIIAIFVGYGDSKEQFAILRIAEASLTALAWLIPCAIVAWVAKKLSLSWRAAFIFTFIVIALVFYVLRQNSIENVG